MYRCGIGVLLLLSMCFLVFGMMLCLVLKGMLGIGDDRYLIVW